MIYVAVSSECPNQVLVRVATGEKTIEGRLTFLDAGIVRVTLDPTGAFAPFATPRSPEHVAHIQAQPDDSEVYARPAASVRDEGAAFVVGAGDTEVLVDKADGRLAFRRAGALSRGRQRRSSWGRTAPCSASRWRPASASLAAARRTAALTTPAASCAS